ncbi:MAG TPA: hypothetical protein VGF99_10630 [Myxococcota bacterium]
MQPQNLDSSLAVNEFQQIIEQLCRGATDDFAAARARLERLRREGPDQTERAPTQQD